MSRIILVEEERFDLLLQTVADLCRKVEALSGQFAHNGEDKKLFSIHEACAYLSVSRRTLLEYRTRGQLTWSQAPGSSRVFFQQSDLDAFVCRYRSAGPEQGKDQQNIKRAGKDGIR